MEYVIPVPLCATLITCAHSPHLASTSNRLLCTSLGTPAPFFVMGPSFPPRTQGPISMLPGAPVAFLGGPGMKVAPPLPYKAIQSDRALLAPYGSHALQHMASMHWSSQPMPYVSAFMVPSSLAGVYA